MVHFSDIWSGAAVAGAEAETTAAIDAPAGVSAADSDADSVAPARVALLASAYVGYGPGNRAAGGAPRLAAADGERASAATADPELAALRAALPAALTPQFDAQLAAAYRVPVGGDGAADEGKSPLSESDLARLVSGDLSDDDGLSLLVSRLAHAVARYGAAPVAQDLRLSHERLTVAVPAGPSREGATGGRRVPGIEERERERDQQRRALRRRPEAPLPSAVRSGDDRGPTVDDVLCYRGTVVASSTTPMPFPSTPTEPSASR